MHIDDTVIAPLEARYGKAEELSMEFAMGEPEFDLLKWSMRRGRAHDVTLFITRDDGQILVIRKPMYPEGVYRTPSGGVDIGEDFEVGAKREAYEETGV